MDNEPGGARPQPAPSTVSAPAPEAPGQAAPGAASPAPPRIPWFWINVGLLCVFAPWMTWWFQQHLQLYFTEIVIVGGALSLWAVVRGMWAILEKAGKVDAWEHSRRLLALPDVAALLAVSCLVFLVLWASTASIYLNFEGAAGEGSYRVEVVRASDGSPLIGPTRLDAAHPVLGLPLFWQGGTRELRCRILEPVRYEALPCDVAPGASTRVDVPGSFRQKDFHLLRLIPTGELFRQLPAIDDQPASRYDLVVRRGTAAPVVYRDLRRQVLYVGATVTEMPILLALDSPTQLALSLRMQLLAQGFDADSVERTTAILSTAAASWPSIDVRRGDVITIDVRVTRQGDAADAREPLFARPLRYTVGDAKVQSLWLQFP